MRDELQLFDDVKETSRMANNAKAQDDLFIVPAFVGLGAPYWDDKAKASIVGLTLGTNRNQIVKAGIESMAYQAKDVMDAMEKDSNLKISKLKVDGGATSNDYLLQFQANLCQCALERFKVTELTALGAAFLAGLAIGYWKLEDLKIEIDQTFEPNKKKEEMDLHFENWHRAIASCQAFKSVQVEGTGHA